MPNSPLAETVFLHIGTQKTGTTTLQALGSRNRGALAKLGLLYPRAPGEVNHLGLPVFAAGGRVKTDLIRGLELRTSSDVADYLETFPGRFQKEIANSGCTKIWLSNEHLSSRIRTPESIAKLAGLLLSLAREVKVVVYLRPQPDFYLSTYSMKIKAGSNKEVPPPATGAEYYYNYEKILSNWANVFGDGAILVRIFERAELVGGDVVDDFFTQIGIDRGPDIVVPQGLNPSLDADALQFLRNFRSHIPRFVEDAPNPEYGDLVKALEAMPVGKKFTLSAADMLRIADMFASSNARVARRFLGRTDGRLFSASTYDDSPATIELGTDRAIAIAAHLWRWKHKQLMDMKQKRPTGPPAPDLGRGDTAT